ncbi:MAG: glycosyltransferase, partial [archaeon]
MKKNLIVTLADENYVQQAKQLFSSIYFNSGWKGDYMLLSHDIPEEKLQWFKKKGIIVKKCKPLSDKIIGFRNWPYTILSKFYLFDKGMSKWDHIIFLDSDIIVRKSLEDLEKLGGFYASYDFRLDGKYPRSIKEQFSKPGIFSNTKDKILFNHLKKEFNLKNKSFNSGVMVIKTSDTKKETLSDLIYLFNSYGRLTKNPDQAILNLYFKKFNILPERYNSWPDYLANYYGLSPSEMEENILHFMGEKKPWLKDSPFFEEWNRNLRNAENINLKKRQPYKKSLSKEALLEYQNSLKKRRKIFYHRHIARYKGMAGNLIQKTIPQVCTKVK